MTALVIAWGITGLAALLVGMRYDRPWTDVVAAALLGPVGLVLLYRRGQMRERRAAGYAPAPHEGATRAVMALGIFALIAAGGVLAVAVATI